MHSEKFGITNHIIFDSSIENYPPFVKLVSKHGEAKIALHGAHVLSFIPKGSEDLLWVSSKALYRNDKAIRGGIPLCFPWFASQAQPAHGFARLVEWEVIGSGIDEEGNPHIRFALESSAESKKLWDYDFSAELLVVLSAQLELRLQVKNLDTKSFTVTEAMHSYFNVSHVENIAVLGLEGKLYHDSLDGDKEKLQKGLIMIDKEIDRLYHDSKEACVIEDSGFNRHICITKENSASTVVWNPWSEKSASMVDFEAGGYQRMVCVEAGNIGKHALVFKSGEVETMSMVLSECKDIHK